MDVVAHTQRLFRLRQSGTLFLFHAQFSPKAKIERDRKRCFHAAASKTSQRMAPPRPSFHKKGEDEPKDAEGLRQIGINTLARSVPE